MATERATHSLPIEKFKLGFHNLDKYIPLFEDAVELSCNPATDARKKELCKKWFPLMLDDAARTVYENITKTTWDAIKVELKTLMIDPQAQYNWKAGYVTVIWDEKESFHELAARVKRCVDLYDPTADKPTQYFFRFRLALPPEFRYAIDTSAAGESKTIEDAKGAAYRFQMALNEMGLTFTSQKSVSFDNGMGKPMMGAAKNTGQTAGHAMAGLAMGQGTSFQAASLDPDRIKTLEMGLQELSIKVGNLKEEKATQSCHSSTNRDRGRYDSRDRDRFDSRDRGHYESRNRGRYDSRDRGRYDSRDRGRHDSHDRGCYDSRDRGYYDSRDRSHYDSRDRGRYDSRDRGRHDDDHERDRHSPERGWQDRHHRRDSPDRRNSPERRDSPDHWNASREDSDEDWDDHRERNRRH